MKQCKKMCAAFREYWPRGYPGEVQGLKWTHCPYCDSGELVDEEDELKDEFWKDWCDTWNPSYGSTSRAFWVDKMFNIYDIKRKP